MDPLPTPVRAPAIRALAQKITAAADPQIMAIVATVDALMDRGQADQLVAPLRKRLKTLRPPRPLRFTRLLFHPLEPLIVPAWRWQRGQLAIPRTVLSPIADHVQQAMAAGAGAIKNGIAGRTTTDTDHIILHGTTLWPAAAAILAQPAIPDKWGATELGVSVYRPVADLIVALLSQAVPLEALCANTANGLLPPDRDSIGSIVDAVARVNKPALPAMLSLLLSRQPKAVHPLMEAHFGTPGLDIPGALDQAADLLMRQFDENDGIEARIAAGTLQDAGAAVNRIASLLLHFDTPNAKPRRREQIRALRHRLDMGCRARFASGLQDEVLAPLQTPGVTPSPEDIATLETAARGLRILDSEARTLSGGGVYDELLAKASDAIKCRTMRDRLSLLDQARLLEILVGSDAAMTLLKAKD